MSLPQGTLALGQDTSLAESTPAVSFSAGNDILIDAILSPDIRKIHVERPGRQHSSSGFHQIA